MSRESYQTDAPWRIGRVPLFLLLLAVSCGDATLDPLPLEITLTATPTTAQTGQTVNFTVNAQGGELFGVEIDYGDGTTSSHPAYGARTARIVTSHVYTSAGTYAVDAVITDALAGDRTASVQITVTALTRTGVE